jgi:hypothetical protein
MLVRSGAREEVRRVGQRRGALYMLRRSTLDGWIEARPIDASSDHQKSQDNGDDREMARRWLLPGGSTAQRGDDDDAHHAGS